MRDWSIPPRRDWSIPIVGEDTPGGAHHKTLRRMHTTLQDLIRHAITKCPPTFTAGDVSRVLREHYEFEYRVQLNLPALAARGELRSVGNGQYQVIQLAPTYPDPKPLPKVALEAGK